MKYVYIVFSSTPYKIGKFIRTFTREDYNHISLMFDGQMQNAYTFGRRHIDAPFWGGLVKDSVSRYKNKNRKAYVNICRVPVEDEKYNQALEKARFMYENRNIYVYNLFSAGISVLKKRLFINNAFTCVEFCCYLLSIMCDRVDKNGFYTVCDVLKLFEEYTVYTGEFNLSGKNDAEFESTCGGYISVKETFNGILELLKRMNDA